MSINTSNSIQPTVVYPNDATTKKTVNPNNEDAQSSFLQLLVAQITNQTPDNTLDATQMITQFSQMNAALGLQKMSASMNAQKLSAATALINQTVTLQTTDTNNRTVQVKGMVSGVDYTDASGEPKLIIDGSTYSLDNVVKVGA